MDQYTDELESTLPAEAIKRPAGWLKDQLKMISVTLLDQPARYKLYGSYWWGLKALLRSADFGPRSAWYRGPCQDETARTQSDHGSNVLNVHAAQTRSRWWDDGHVWLDRPDSGLCICEWPSHQVEMYHLSDTDTGHQLDLFESADHQAEKLRHYLETVSEFLPRTWRSHGDRALEDHNCDRAAACYQRMVQLATSRSDRSEAWLLLGMTFDQKKHWHKAIFCYRNLYEKENEHWILGNMASSFFHAGQIREAVLHYEQAIKQMPGNPEFEAGLEVAQQQLQKLYRSEDELVRFELAHA